MAMKHITDFAATATATTNSYVSFPTNPIPIPLGHRAMVRVLNSGANAVLVRMVSHDPLSTGARAAAFNHTPRTIAAGEIDTFDTTDDGASTAIAFSLQAKAAVDGSQGAVLFTGVIGKNADFAAVISNEVTVEA